MYVIHINDRPLYLRSGDESALDSNALGDSHLTVRYSGKKKTLLHYVDMLEKGSPKVSSVEIITPDLAELWTDFCGHYRWVPAAGGVVRQAESGKTLFIYRRGFWDLPKGKLDRGERIPDAALREVREETGLSDLQLGDQLPTTYHTYRNKKKVRILKPVYWFRMTTPETSLVPQHEEDIEEAVWTTVAEVRKGPRPVYGNLIRLLDKI